MSHKGEGEVNRLVLLMLGRDVTFCSRRTSIGPWSVRHLHVYMEKWRIPPGPSQFLRIGFNLADLGSRRDMPIWRDGGFGMASTKPQLTVMEKAADPIPASRVLFWGGACSILFGLGSLVAILLRTTRFDLPVIRIAEVFIAIGLLSIVAGLALRAREAKGSRVRHGLGRPSLGFPPRRTRLAGGSSSLAVSGST